MSVLHDLLNDYTILHNGEELQEAYHNTDILIWQNCEPFYLISGGSWASPNKVNGWNFTHSYGRDFRTSASGGNVNLYGADSTHQANGYASTVWFDANRCRHCEINVAQSNTNSGGVSIYLNGKTASGPERQLYGSSAVVGTHNITIPNDIVQVHLDVHLTAWYTNTSYVKMSSVRFY